MYAAFASILPKPFGFRLILVFVPADVIVSSPVRAIILSEIKLALEVMLPVAVTTPLVVKFPPLTLPVAVISPPVPKLPTLALPLVFNVPVILAPVEVTFIVAVLPTIMFTLPPEVGILTFDVPFEIRSVVSPVSCEPLPIKKLAAMLPLASLSAIVFAVFAVAAAAFDSKLAFKLATSVFEVTRNGVVP